MRCTLVGSRYFGATVFDALTQRCVRDRARRRAGRRRSAGARGSSGRRSCPRPRQSQDRSGKCDSRRHRSHRRRAYACPRQQRGARAIASRRHRLPSFAAAAPSRHRRGGMDDPRRRFDRGRLGLSSGRWLGRGRHCGARLVLRRRGESARELWERALAPMGLALLARVVRHADQQGTLPGYPQDECFADQGADDPPYRFAHRGTTTHDRLTRGHRHYPDRPGIVSKLSAQAQRFGANWSGSRMASLAGQFAGIVHLEVPDQNAEAMAARCAISNHPTCASSSPAAKASYRLPATRRGQARTGRARPAGIVRDLSGALPSAESASRNCTRKSSSAPCPPSTCSRSRRCCSYRGAEQRRTAARPRSAGERNDGRHRARRSGHPAASRRSVQQIQALAMIVVDRDQLVMCTCSATRP